MKGAVDSNRYPPPQDSNDLSGNYWFASTAFWIGLCDLLKDS
jgi:hypothetical protein